MSKKTDLLRAMSLQYLADIDALDSTRRCEIATAERKYLSLKEAAAANFNKEYTALANSFDICECDVPCCADLSRKPMVFDRCNSEATTTLINKETGKTKDFCDHCAGNYLKSGDYVEVK